MTKMQGSIAPDSQGVRGPPELAMMEVGCA